MRVHYPAMTMMLERTQGTELQEETISRASDVKRIRIGRYIGEHGNFLLLGLNGPAARDLMSTPTFWYHMDALGQEPVFLREDEMVPGYYSQAQAVLVPKKIEGATDECGPDLTDEQITDFARKCVEGRIVRRWAVSQTEAVRNGVIVCDNRRMLPDNLYDTGPGNSDVIAASLPQYETRR